MDLGQTRLSGVLDDRGLLCCRFREQKPGLR
jgi:hypothetical protein